MPLDRPKFLFAFFLGILSIILAGLPLVSSNTSSYPAFLMPSGSVLTYLVVIVGAIFIFLSFICQDDQVMWTLVIFGLLTTGIGIFEIISKSSLSFLNTANRIFLIIDGIGLIVDAWGSK